MGSFTQGIWGIRNNRPLDRMDKNLLSQKFEKYQKGDFSKTE
jgi:hypothetical protein